MKILLAVDGSVCSDTAVEDVARKPWPEGSELKVVTAIEPSAVPAVEPWLVPPDYFRQIENAEQNKAQSTVDYALSKLRENQSNRLKLSASMRVGSPKHVILDTAEEWGADLIVVGSHGYGIVDRLMLGSVSNAVATQAKCSVEIVRRKLA